MNYQAEYRYLLMRMFSLHSLNSYLDLITMQGIYLVGLKKEVKIQPRALAH